MRPRLPFEGDIDLYAVEAALTSLTHEIKLQGRSFKQLQETVAPVAEMVEPLAELMAEARRQAEERVLKEVLEALLDIRDRLTRGALTARATGESIGRGTWIERIRGTGIARAREAVAALGEASSLTSEYTAEVLERFEVREIPCLGEMFDPARMHAVATEPAADAAEGVVVEVFRPGYEWKGQVYRPAQVKVARR